MIVFLRAALALSIALLATVPAGAATRCDELRASATVDDVAAMVTQINGGEKVNCRDSLTAETALMAAATNGFVDTVKFLLALGADPKIKNAKGETALDILQAREATVSKMPNMEAVAEQRRKLRPGLFK